MDSAKKQHERFLLDRFLEHQGIIPARIVPGESPDFLIDLEGRKIGIEVTELFIRSNKSKAHPQSAVDPLLQEVESITNRIVSKALKMYLDAGNPLVMLDIYFSEQITLKKTKVEQIARHIADLIQSMNLQNSQKFDWRSSEAKIDHPLSNSVSLIFAQGVPERRFAHWTVMRPGIVAPLTPKYLQNVIDKKAKKIDSYKKCAEEIWLLIVANRTLPSQMLYVAPDFSLDSVSSHFAKTFYYGYPVEGVIEITNKAKTSGAK